MASLNDITRNQNIQDIWDIVRRFTRNRWTETTIPTLPQMIAMMSLSNVTNVVIFAGASSPVLLTTLDTSVKHAALVYPADMNSWEALQRATVGASITYDEMSGQVLLNFSEMPSQVSLIVNDMLAGDDQTSEVQLLAPPLQVRAYDENERYVAGDLAIVQTSNYGDAPMTTIAIAKEATTGAYNDASWTILAGESQLGFLSDSIAEQIQAETARAQQAESDLATAIGDETTARESAIEQVTSSIEAEALERAQGDSASIAAVNDETTARQQAIQQLESELATETQNRESGDEQNAQAIAAEATARAEDISHQAAALQQEVENRSATDVTAISFDVGINTLTITRTDGTTEHVAFPVADTTQNGFMTNQQVKQIEQNTQDILNLKGTGTRRLTSLVIDADTTQDDFNDAWLDASGQAAPVDNDTLVSLAETTLWNQATYIESNAEWVFRPNVEVNPATNTAAGIVVGKVATSNTMENGGSIYVETDASMSVNGWDDATSRVQALESFKNRTSGFATAQDAANASTALTNSQTALNTANQVKADADAGKFDGATGPAGAPGANGAGGVGTVAAISAANLITALKAAVDAAGIATGADFNAAVQVGSGTFTTAADQTGTAQTFAAYVLYNCVFTYTSATLFTVKSLVSAGSTRGATGATGPAGANGTDGQDGADGKTPTFSINASTGELIATI